MLINELLKGIVETAFSIFDVLLSILPSSPFGDMLSSIGEINYLGYLNYFLPFDFAVNCFSAWLVCVFAFYVYRFLKSIILKFF